LNNTVIGLIILGGSAYWTPSLLRRFRHLHLALAAGLMLLPAAAAIPLALAGGYGPVPVMLTVAYMAALAGMGWVLAWALPGHAEGVHTAAGMFMWGGALIAGVSLPALVRWLLLAFNPPVVIAGILGVNIYRDQWYSLAPLGDTYLRLPAWWQALAVLIGAAVAMAGAGAMVRLARVRWSVSPSGIKG
jgi:hypothetical protein